MNGYKLLEDAARLIGLESVDENLKIIGLPIVNEIISDLGFSPLCSLMEKVGVSSQKAQSALRFGVAALVANAIGDESARNSMADIYSGKLTSLTSHIERVKDVLPKGEG